ncbi:MAG: Gfo/Idh/MocA family oxidoreductase [Clostridiales Family XIII bacterium]|jgi:myo-inositol 2-dehydrogenase/D-chiro-inositol 1-dehydrogenase|nr:Gfo/Idh/MocA family oxidoreductase [Clostridiales Family XIII bacterium]
MEKLRIGVIGTGAIGREHIKRLSERIVGCETVAVADVDRDAAERVASLCGAKCCESGEELILSPEVDAVLVASWDATHAKYVLAAVAEGKYVFCEKPLSPETKDCERILEAESALGKRIVQVGFMRRFDSGYRALKAAIKSGVIGNPLMIHACHRNMTHAATMTSEMSIKNAGIHEIDIMRWLLEEEYVQGQVLLPRQNGISRKENLQDPQIMLLRTESGVTIDVELNQSSGYGYDIQCEAVGEEGTVRLPDPATVVTRARGACSFEVRPGWETRFTEAYDIELQQWVDEVKADRITGPSAWDGTVACHTAVVLGECRESGEIRGISYPHCPDFYKNMF